ncbi:3,4-dihydroxy-2-butanone-4-phosphate synthase [Vibrio cholerae]
MNQSSLLAEFGDPITRVENALQALREGRGVLLLDDEDRENEGDIIYAVESLTTAQMALMIRECSGIVCLCLTEAQADRLALPPMVVNNNSANQTAFTVSIEAKHGVTTGVSAQDRVTTIKTAANPQAKPEDLARRGHTEGTVDLMQMAGLQPAGVLCELTNPDGSMAKTPEIIAFGKLHNMPVLTIEDMVQYRIQFDLKLA